MNTKIALITGSSRGLGKSMALAAAHAGHDVMVTYNSKKEEAQNVVHEIEKMGRKAVALQLNTGASKTFDAFVNAVKAVLKEHWNRDRFDFLVNNAGIGIQSPLMETTEEQIDELYQIHFKGVYLLSQKLLPVMNDGGRIINISSGLARFSFPGYSAYGAMKGAVETLTRYMAKELGSRRINVNVVAPGAIETDFRGGQVRDDKVVNQQIASVTALGRVGLPDDIGGVVAMLLSEEARWINGQRIEASGGMML